MMKMTEIVDYVYSIPKFTKKADSSLRTIRLFTVVINVGLISFIPYSINTFLIIYMY